MSEGAAPPTTITYMFTLEDMLQKLPPKSAAAAPLRNATLGWLLVGVILLWVAYFAVLEKLKPTPPADAPPAPAAMITWPWTMGLVLLTVLIFWLYIRGFLKRHYGRLTKLRAMGPLPLKATVTLEADGFRVKTVVADSLVYWGNMYAIVQGDSYLFLAVNIAQFYPIPLTAFSSPAEAEAFRQEANRRMREAGGGSTVPDESFPTR